MSVVVVGSANLDLVYRVPTIPAPGETILATDRSQHLGGKGNNQATAAARAGADTAFVAALGEDEAGELIMAGLADAGISAQVRRVHALPTGTALITVDDQGENAIVVDSGANAELLDLTPDELSAVSQATILLMQLEIPLTTVLSAATQARRSDTLVVLNAAPMRALPDELLAATDVLIVNETEASQLTDQPDPDGAARRLLDSVPNVIITVDADGAVVASRDAQPQKVPGRKVDVVDTTGAGDAFCGALVADLGRSIASAAAEPDLIAAVEFATRAAALSVQRVGAVPSIPSREEIDQLG